MRMWQELVKRSPYHKATSNDVDWMQKVKMQGAIQKWVDHSISVTINLPSDAKEELVGELYVTCLEKWLQGSHGIPGRIQVRCPGGQRQERRMQKPISPSSDPGSWMPRFSGLRTTMKTGSPLLACWMEDPMKSSQVARRKIPSPFLPR